MIQYCELTFLFILIPEGDQHFDFCSWLSVVYRGKKVLEVEEPKEE